MVHGKPELKIGKKYQRKEGRKEGKTMEMGRNIKKCYIIAE